jgi:hypothetical protein
MCDLKKELENAGKIVTDVLPPELGGSRGGSRGGSSGGGGGGLGGFLASIDPSTAISRELTKVAQPIEEAINELGVEIDKGVNKAIPGGWATVAAATAYYLSGGFSDFGFGSAAAAGSAEAAGYTAAELAAAEGAAGATAAEYTALTQAGAAQAAGATTATELASAAVAPAGTGLTVTPTAAASGNPYEFAAKSGEGLKLPTAPNIPSMGGGQGLVVDAATMPQIGALDVGQVGQLSAAGLTSGYALPKIGVMDAAGTKSFIDQNKKKDQDQSTTTTATDTSIDKSSAFAEALGLVYKRRKESLSRRSYAEGGVVKPTEPSTRSPSAINTGTEVSAYKPAVVTAGPVTAGTSTAKDVTATGVTAPTKVASTAITADTAQSKVETALNKVAAEQGTVSDKAQAAAVSMKPEDTALSGVQAAQGVATKVVAPTDRKLETGELVTGSAVDMARVEDTLAKAKAAEGTVTEEMTTQGQLNKLLTDFDAKAPPPWAAASIRAVTAQLAARGLGASSLAGQAVIQATLEAGLPIAQADAKVFENMGLVNLSNRQQTAILVAQQRADFLKQDFDDNFKAKVLNAAKISDIANKNFDAATTIALENARLVGSMDIANLSARNAVVLAKAAQMANLETTNLNNRQLVAVENSKAFLAMDLKNLDNKQQVSLFKAKEVADSIVSDTAQANAIKATNATNALDAEKINASLALTASQYNAAELNKVAIFNKTASDEMVRFNAQESNDRAEFNATMSNQINVANAKLLADISMANTRETNAIAAVNAKNATDLAASTYAQLSQTYRDQIEQSWKTTDNANDRANKISVTTLTANATEKAAQFNADAAFSAAIGQLSISILAGGGSKTIMDSILDGFKNLIKK